MQGKTILARNYRYFTGMNEAMPIDLVAWTGLFVDPHFA
jgi:hypothetical protein